MRNINIRNTKIDQCVCTHARVQFVYIHVQYLWYTVNIHVQYL